MQTLDKKVLEEKRTCKACPETYDLQARQQETKKLSKPNTADQYCCDIHWAKDTSLYE